MRAPAGPRPTSLAALAGGFGLTVALGVGGSRAGVRLAAGASADDPAVAPPAAWALEASLPPLASAPPLRRARPDRPGPGVPPPGEIASAKPEPVRTVDVTTSVVDAEDRSPVPDATWSGGFVVGGGDRPPARRSGTSLAVPVDDGEAGAAFEVSADAGGERPDGSRLGWVSLAQGLRFPISRYAAAVDVVWPVFREADVLLDVTVDGASPPDGLAVSVGSAWVGPMDVAVRDEAAPGGLRMRGLPFLHGAPWRFRVHGRLGEAWAAVDVAGTFGVDPGDRVAVSAALPALAVPSRSSRGRGGCRQFAGGGCSGWIELEDGPTGRLALVVQRRDGRPAASAGVVLMPTDRRHRLERADADGVVRARDLPVGPCGVRLAEDGLVPTVGEVDVSAGGEVRATLVEAPPASVDVLVVDETGRPVPSARLLVKPAHGTWVELEGDRQREDPFTGRDGRRTVGGLGAGTTTVRAVYGGREATASVELDVGGTDRVTLTLAPPVPKPAPAAGD